MRKMGDREYKYRFIQISSVFLIWKFYEIHLIYFTGIYLNARTGVTSIISNTHDWEHRKKFVH